MAPLLGWSQPPTITPQEDGEPDFTRISFKIDLERFGLKELDEVGRRAYSLPTQRMLRFSLSHSPRTRMRRARQVCSKPVVRGMPWWRRDLFSIVGGCDGVEAMQCARRRVSVSMSDLWGAVFNREASAEFRRSSYWPRSRADDWVRHAEGSRTRWRFSGGGWWT